MAVSPGYKIWQYLTPLTTAASPLVSPWLDTTGFTIILPWFLFVAGTSVHSLEGSFDGSTLDTDLTAAYAAPTSLTPITVVSPYVRWRTVQTVANATTSKIFLQSRA
jgi:hypothetical protein